jgi:RNA polymerase sigma-70 factor (ECF subfamily)
VLGVLEKFSRGDEYGLVEVNGQPAVLVTRDGLVRAVLTMDATPAGIDRLLFVLNPEKLARLGPPVG